MPYFQSQQDSRVSVVPLDRQNDSELWIHFDLLELAVAVFGTHYMASCS